MTNDLRAAIERADRSVFGHDRMRPSEVFTALAAACDDLGIDTWDTYGDGGAVTRLEAEVASVLGTPGALFFISGTMAQQATLRVYADRSGHNRVALPDLSHLVRREFDAARILHGLQLEMLTSASVVPTVADLDAIPGALAAVLVELPLRDAGAITPSFAELQALAEATRARGAAFHIDGARVWEIRPHLGVSLPEIAALADSIYVSFYKGLGGLAGACIGGDEALLAELRVWRARMGGTLYRMTPYAVSALVGLRTHLPQMASYFAWTQEFVAALPAHGITVAEGLPHSNTLHLYAAGSPSVINERLLAFIERTGTQLCTPWRSTPVPGQAVCEVAVLSASLRFDPAQVAAWIGEITAVPSAGPASSPAAASGDSDALPPATATADDSAAPAPSAGSPASAPSSAAN